MPAINIDEADLADLRSLLEKHERQQEAWIAARHTTENERSECRRQLRWINRVRNRLPLEV